MELLHSLWAVVVAVANLLVALVIFVAPWVPLLAWIAFWLCAVNWRRLYPVLMKGGMIGVVLIGLIAMLVWSMVSFPDGGVHRLYGLEVSNMVGKMVYVTSLTVIAFLCGSVQLSGCCDSICCFNDKQDPAPEEAAQH
ncbi:hypothetical protein KOR42_00650 [Thalassoglobus neptunius]|uniref:Transmembrane protein n=1 Tax=Thalassoglobus neptunius TaxID=1938619 RepID=A0A5C5X358_9PLAN|nr:hypothetical protein [Thalassoglobus neptunius]TWT56711.1 hypothetical protein KOR42_00650 [Thalassoglobus neptunius]